MEDRPNGSAKKRWHKPVDIPDMKQRIGKKVHPRTKASGWASRNLHPRVPDASTQKDLMTRSGLVRLSVEDSTVKRLSNSLASRLVRYKVETTLAKP